MWTEWSTALGGLGLLLVGLAVLTQGLRSLAGDRVHRTLRRFARTPWTGVLTGAGLTAVLQSSSLTTVATVGFVHAGLLTFPLALGIVLGANVGTTVTGWLVALFGLEFDLAGFAGPALLLGALLRMFAPGAASRAGWAVAGFALLLLGIDAMQSGLAGFEGRIGPADFPADTWGGRGLIVGLGAAITLVTQSSSAGVATALAAVHAGTISFAQAGALVIGMDVGTTSTTLLATIGAGAASRRTGLAHVIYNLMTGGLAFFLLDAYVAILDALGGQVARHPTFALVGFHSAFNVLGVLLILPWVAHFARWMTRLVPDTGTDLGGDLDETLLADPPSAAGALHRAVTRIAAALFTDAATASIAPRIWPPCLPPPIASKARVAPVSAIAATRPSI